MGYSLGVGGNPERCMESKIGATGDVAHIEKLRLLQTPAPTVVSPAVLRPVMHEVGWVYAYSMRSPRRLSMEVT